MVRWRRLAWVVVALPLLGSSSCPGDGSDVPDAAVSDAAGLDGGPPLRDVTFGALPPGDLAQVTLNGITLTPGPFNGSQSVSVQDLFGEGQDIGLACGTLDVRAPEAHRSFALTFNDDNGTIYVSIFDPNGVMIGDSAIDTHADAQTDGIVRVDAIYKRLSAAIAADSPVLIGSLSIASCAGALHEITLQ
jgi:hypothetical protein